MTRAHFFRLAACLISLTGLSAACKTPASATTQEGAAVCPATEIISASDAQRALKLRGEAISVDDVVERAITFTSEGTTLQATLTLPQLETSAQLPGVLLLQDWGKSTRLGSTQGSLGIQLPVEVHLYEMIAHELARQGFAVMRFDKRNCLQDSSLYCSYPRDALEPHLRTLGDVLTRDAEQALDALRQQPEVSPARVAVVGHGQGADIALAMTSGVHGPAALVLLSPSMSPIHDIIAYQTTYSLNATREQLTRQADDPLADLLRKQLAGLEQDERTQREQFARLEAPSSTDPATIQGLPIETWRSFNALHQRAFAALTHKSLPPTLAILGELDADLPESNAQQLTAQLGGLLGARLELLADTTHDMILIDESTPDPPTMHPMLGTQISDFLYKNLTRP